MAYIMNSDGEIMLFTGNFDKDTAIVNTFPRPILTKRIQILPITWKGETAALRAEFIGCQSGCISSLGVCQDQFVNGETPINTVKDSQMSASQG